MRDSKGRPGRAAPPTTATTNHHTAYGRAALERELADLRQTTAARNVALNRAAYYLGQLVGGGALDEHAATEELLNGALEIGLNQHEARSTIRSGLNAGKKRPRSAPEQAQAPKPSAPERPDYRLREHLRKLGEDPAFPLEWETAKLLATLPPALAQRDILDSWEWLSERVSIPRLWSTVNLLRGVAMFRYCDAKGVQDPEAIGRAVQRLVREVE